MENYVSRKTGSVLLRILNLTELAWQIAVTAVTGSLWGIVLDSYLTLYVQLSVSWKREGEIKSIQGESIV